MLTWFSLSVCVNDYKMGMAMKAYSGVTGEDAVKVMAHKWIEFD
jgi:hypothetical protein